ncbi:homocysteine S-methyltransferase family protein [bacterium]|nr:homocysteine S-methyltransferase family protein [bacterium]MBU1880971.1 homocysteine S-methyltransferase family protein [bacterium]
MRPPITERIHQRPPLLFDGGFGSRLISMGLPSGMAPEAWVLENPDKIQQVHGEYVAAGSDVIVACTFGGNRIRLEKVGLEDKVTEVNLKAVELAKAASQDTTYIAVDLGPTGEFFEPHGALTETVAQEVYEEQAGLLAETGIDFFMLETFYDLKEAQICLSACQKMAPQIPVGVTLTFNQTPRGFFTVMGNPAAESLNELAANGAFLVGANCTLEAEGMAILAAELKQKVSAPLLFQANAGSPQIKAGDVVYPQGPEEFAEFGKTMLSLGIQAIGGCCGSTPEHIIQLRQIINVM